MNGFTGKILHVNLNDKSIEIEEPSEEFYRHYAGGSLMGLYYLWKNTPQGADALSPDNTLTFAMSAPTGLPVSGQAAVPRPVNPPAAVGLLIVRRGASGQPK